MKVPERVQALGSRARQALDDNVEAAVGRLRHLANHGQGADPAQRVGPWILAIAILKEQEDEAIASERPVDRLDRDGAIHREGLQGEWEDDRLPQRSYRVPLRAGAASTHVGLAIVPPFSHSSSLPPGVRWTQALLGQRFDVGLAAQAARAPAWLNRRHLPCKPDRFRRDSTVRQSTSGLTQAADDAGATAGDAWLVSGHACGDGARPASRCCSSSPARLPRALARKAERPVLPTASPRRFRRLYPP